MTAQRFCEGCGRRASADARFCGACGRPFAGPAGDAPGRPAPGPREAADAAPSGEEQIVFDLRGVAVRTVGEFVLCVLTVGLVWVWLAICRRRLRYRVTNQRIEIVSGIVTVTRRTTDLFRIHDLEVVEPFFLRMRGAGNLIVRAQDSGDPEIVLEAIPGVRNVHETLRKLVSDERRRMHVKVVEDSTL